MFQAQFALQRNELIAQYRRSVQPAWQEYQAELARAHRLSLGDDTIWLAGQKFRNAIKPHLELLFARIANLKQQLEVNPK